MTSWPAHQRFLPSSPPKRSPTLYGQGWHNLLIHVVHVISHDEVSRVGARTAHPAGVYVEGSHQWVDARVIDNLEATEDLNLLPAVQALPQCCRHLAQSLPKDRWKRIAGMGWVWVPAGMRPLKGTTWGICVNKKYDWIINLRARRELNKGWSRKPELSLYQWRSKLGLEALHTLRLWGWDELCQSLTAGATYLAVKILWSTSSREELWATWKVPKSVFLFFFIFSAWKDEALSLKRAEIRGWKKEECLSMAGFPYS